MEDILSDEKIMEIFERVCKEFPDSPIERQIFVTGKIYDAFKLDSEYVRNFLRAINKPLN